MKIKLVLVALLIAFVCIVPSSIRSAEHKETERYNSNLKFKNTNSALLLRQSQPLFSKASLVLHSSHWWGIQAGCPVTFTSEDYGCSGSTDSWYYNAVSAAGTGNWQWSIDYKQPGANVYINSPTSPSTWVDISGGGATIKVTYTDACGVSQQAGFTLWSSCN